MSELCENYFGKKKHGQLHSPRRRSEVLLLVLLLLHSPLASRGAPPSFSGPHPLCLRRCSLLSLLLQPQTSRKCFEYYGSCAAAVRLWEGMRRWREMIDSGAGQSASWILLDAVGLCGCCYSVDFFFLLEKVANCNRESHINKLYFKSKHFREKYNAEIKINVHNLFQTLLT